MNTTILPFEPYNLIITGVGGQGNVLASRVVGKMLMEKGLNVTIGETFGASQRGGSVMSHLRISKDSDFSPQIPKGKAHMVIALEPTEALRVLNDYGNPDVNILYNTRPIHSMGVICGEQEYPSNEDLDKGISMLSKHAWAINTTDDAVKLGNPIFGNIMIVGALASTGILPLDLECFEKVIARIMPADKVQINLTAFEQGEKMIPN
jgi:indolepyruvate ferredoxin oxidoreductase beta subunit